MQVSSPRDLFVESVVSCVSSNMGTSLENVFGRLCGLSAELRDGSTRVELDVPRSGMKIALCAGLSGKNNSGRKEACVGLWLDPRGREKSVLLAELGTIVIEGRSPKEMQQSFLLLFLELCFIAFLGITRKDIMDLEVPGWRTICGIWKRKISKRSIEELLRLEINPDTIEARVYEEAFNSIFYAACYSLLPHHITQGNEIESYKAELKKLTTKTLQNIGLHATERLMKSVALKRTRILSKYNDVKVNELKISYTSRLDNSWKMHCYCPLLEMERKKHYGKVDGRLQKALNHQLLQCMFSLDSVVGIQGDCIKVEIKIGHLQCKPLKLGSDLEREQYFPAKIRLTMGPERKSGVHDLSLGESSPNPSASVSNATRNQISLQVEVSSGGPSLGLGSTNADKTTSTHMRRNWISEREKLELIIGQQDWTLHDHSYGKPVFDYQPLRRDQYYKAFKALGKEAGSERPFTRDGGINFEGEMCGPAMTWLLNNKDFEREALKWSVEVEIWLAYYPNEYSTKHMEVKYAKFTEMINLGELVQHIEVKKTKFTEVINLGELVQHIDPQPQHTDPHLDELQIQQMLSWMNELEL